MLSNVGCTDPASKVVVREHACPSEVLVLADNRHEGALLRLHDCLFAEAVSPDIFGQRLRSTDQNIARTTVSPYV